MYFLIMLKVEKNNIKICRVFGADQSYGDLHTAAINNYTDVFEEGYFNYATIVWIENGLYPREIPQAWFRWRDKNEIIETLDRPREIPLTNFIIG